MASKKTSTAVAEVSTEEKVSVTSLKAFNADLTCRGFQFEIGKTYSIDGKVIACERGFHAVDPATAMHVWDFYPLVDDAGRLIRYAEVVQSGTMVRQDDNHGRGTKIASAEITIKAEITLPDFIKRAITALMSAVKGGDEEVKEASGHSSKLAASGDSSQLAASGDSSQLAASGDYSKLAASGDYSKLAASGDYSKLAASGHSSQLSASGDYSKLSSDGESGVLAISGVGGRAKGAAGTWIAVAEFATDGKTCLGFATGRVGADGIKPDTWYVAKGGKLVEDV
jgi:hypothetical protein